MAAKKEGERGSMNSFWQTLLAWCRSKNITTHTIGAAIIGFAVAYDSSSQLRDYIGTLFTGFPVVVTTLGTLCANIAAGVALWRNYSHSSSPAGTLATARQIQTQPDAPTAAQVDAATITK
jgi:hypothetical protein